MVNKIQIEPNKLFAWSKGQRLTPDREVTIMLPGGLIREQECIGSIIDVADEAEIGFQPSENPNEAFGYIILKLKEGQSACINRSTQAMMVQPLSGAAYFEVEN